MAIPHAETPSAASSNGPMGPATPLFHAGPFDNIEQGTSFVIAEWVALATDEVVCQQASFGADLGTVANTIVRIGSIAAGPTMLRIGG